MFLSWSVGFWVMRFVGRQGLGRAGLALSSILGFNEKEKCKEDQEKEQKDRWMDGWMDADTDIGSVSPVAGPSTRQ
jgi:ribosome modulation factor